jgi:hypothetical protein
MCIPTTTPAGLFKTSCQLVDVCAMHAALHVVAGLPLRHAERTLPIPLLLTTCVLTSFLCLTGRKYALRMRAVFERCVPPLSGHIGALCVCHTQCVGSRLVYQQHCVTSKREQGKARSVHCILQCAAAISRVLRICLHLAVHALYRQ